MHRRHLIIFSIIALSALMLALALVVTQPAAAQPLRETPLTLVVADLAGQRQPGVAFTVTDERETIAQYVTDAAGTATLTVTGDLAWIRGATLADGTALSMESNTLEGGLRLSLTDDPITIPFALDSGVLFQIPFVMDNPAYPDGVPGAPIFASDALDAPDAPVLAPVSGDVGDVGAPAPEALAHDQAPTPGLVWQFWVAVLALLLLSVGVGLVVWRRARASRAGGPLQ